MEISENIFTKNFSVETENPYLLAYEFMKKLSAYYMIYERKNVFETNGPTKKAVLIFDVVENIDPFSQVSVNFSMESNNTTLFVEISGEFVLRLKEEGFFSEAFAEFYMSNMFQPMRAASQRRMKELETELSRL